MNGSCEIRKRQVHIGHDAANVLMVSTVKEGKVERLEMHVDEFYARVEDLL